MRSFGPSPVLVCCSTMIAVLLFALLPAFAQDIINVNSEEFNGDLFLAYESASDGDTLLLGLLPDNDDDDENGESAVQRIQTYTLSDTLLLDKSVTIRGDSALLPSLIVVQHAGALDGPVIEVDEGVTVRLEGFAITGGTSGVLGRIDANISINRCYIHRNTEAGIELNNIGSATITNTAIVNNGIYGLRVLGDLDAAIGNVEVGQSTFIGNGSDFAFDETPSSSCVFMNDSITQWEEFAADDTYGLGASSLDSGGIPVSFLLALVREVVCENTDATLASAVHQTSINNRTLLRGETTIINEDAVLQGEAPITVAEVLEPYEDAIAVALSLDSSLQLDLITMLEVNGLSLSESYAIVECVFEESDDDGDEGSWECDDDLGNSVAPFSGGGDIDRDDLTNTQEYSNVVGNGGTEQAFARAATDPLRDGSEITIMPDTVGLSLMEARNQLEQAGLGPVTVSRRIDDAPFGEVIEQRPDADEVLLEGTPVHLVVSNKESGAAIMTAAGGTMVYATLFHRNARGIDHQGGDAVASWGNFFNNNDVEDIRGDVTLEVEAPDEQVVSLASGTWIGKLDTAIPIQSGLDIDDYPESLSGNNLDFERDPRGGDIIQVGADEVNAALGLSWLNCIITPDPAGLADRVSILIELGTGLTASSVDILIRPETLLPVDAETNPDQMLEMDDLVILDSLTLQGFLTVRDGLVSGDASFILDGRAQVYLLGAGELYGVGTTNELFMAPGAIEGSNFLIDITPPIILGGIRANQFVINSNDNTVAPVSLSTYPLNWVPGYEATPASGVQLANQEDSQGEPQIFFNLKNAEPYPPDTFPLLNFDVVVTFEDRPPEGYPNIEIAGFENVRLSEETFLAVAFSGGETQLMLSGANELQPNPADYVQVGGFTTGNSDAGYPTLSITWQFRDLNYLRAEDLLFRNDWRLTGQFRVVSSQGNITTRSNRFHMWWMHRAQAQITSSKYEGRRTDDPSFAWGLVRGERSPQNAFPAFPMAMFQIFAMNAGTWQPVAGPSPWIAERTIDRFTVIDADSGMRLGELLQNFPTGQFLISIIGADEAGNVQNPDWINADMDYWENEPESASIDTNIQGRFWYFDAIEGILPDRELGPATRIMLPSCDLDMRINGEFLLRAVAAGQRIDGIAWRFYRNGVLLNDGVINGVQGTLSLLDDLLGLDWIDQCQDVSETSTILRTQEFVLEAAGISGADVDPNPASYRFQFVADMPLYEDQPIKETVRE